LLLEGLFSSTKVEATEGRFITSPVSNVSDEIYDDQVFAGPQLTFHFKQVDQPILTRRGLEFKVSTGFESDLNNGDTHRWLRSELAVHYQFKYLGKPILAMRLGAETHGGSYDFFQAAHLGSKANFRGVSQERFTGDNMFYHNTDLRFVLFKWKSYYLPAMFGILGSFDHGRVWLEGEDSSDWHYAYGGGIWISPFQTMIMSLNYHVSDVDERFSFGMGFFF
jgi:outer membrane protein assembly factor BamA